VLEQGELAVWCRLDGVERVLPAVAAPGYVGELGLINSAPRSATIVTAADSRLLRMDVEDFGDARRAVPMSSAGLARAGVGGGPHRCSRSPGCLAG
jgi:CRP-like cAMP-binding protein